MTPVYQPALVALSILVAMLAALSALDLASRIAHETGRAKVEWLVGGAFVLGTGIWAMHFIGMMAFELPVHLGYDVDVTVASMLPALLGAGCALYLIQRERITVGQVATGGVLLGGGIGAMHYVGMAAMRMTPPVTYEPTWFVLSVVFAVGAGALAIFVARRAGDAVRGKFIAAAVMGLAIAGMHYMGMQALIVPPNSVCISGFQGPSVPFGYNGWLVALSISIAVMASYTALDVGSRVTQAAGRRRWAWVGGGGVAMGTGIWAMHFIGMLAFHIDRAVDYDALITFVSLLPAIASATFALHIVQRDQMRPRVLGMGGLLMGSGIGAMHYIGMAAMEVAPGIRYDATFFALSLLVAVAASISALWIAFKQHTHESFAQSAGRKFGSALVMGLAISGMHYAGMTAAHFLPLGANPAGSGGLDSTYLAIAVGIGTALILLLAYVMAFYDGRIAQLNQRLAAQLHDANQQLHREATAMAQAMTQEIRARAEQDRKLATIVEQSGEAIIATDLRGVVQSWNRAAQGIFGQTAERAIGAPLQALALQGTQNTLGALLRASPEGAAGRLGLVTPDGTPLVVQSALAQHCDAAGQMIGHIATVRDVTRQVAAETALQQERDRARVTLASIGDAVFVTNADGRIEYINPVAGAMVGVSGECAAGQRFRELVSLREEMYGDPVVDPVQQCLGERKRVNLAGDAIVVNGAGAHFAVDGCVAPIIDAGGQLTGCVAVLVDVTDKRTMLRELRWQALHDALTGLDNRHAFDGHLRRAVKSARRDGSEHALLYLDLDQFKLVNDSSGHAAGDRLLRDVAALLRTRLRERDMVARLGGDEFAVLLDTCSFEQALSLAEDIRAKLAQLKFVTDSRSFACTVSGGLVPITRNSHSVAMLLSAADAACYVAKESGRNRIHADSEATSEAAKRRGEMQWVDRLTQAIEQSKLVLHAQSIHPLQGGAEGPAHVEVLLRLLDDAGQLVQASVFVPAAERYGLMPRVDRWVIGNALDQCAAHYRHHPDSAASIVTVNISGASLNDADMLGFLRQRITEAALPAQCILCLEITETVAVGNLAHARRFMAELRALGCRFSLDDFGVGMSSFSYLKNLPTDYLKIDQSFVSHMRGDSIDKALLEAIHRVGKAVGVSTIAEGVEDADTLATLTGIGIDFAQGYHLARPEPLAAFFKSLVQP